jgi:hypothetical protein
VYLDIAQPQTAADLWQSSRAINVGNLISGTLT